MSRGRHLPLAVLSALVMIAAWPRSAGAYASWSAREYPTVKGTVLRWNHNPEDYVAAEDSAGMALFLRTTDAGASWTKAAPTLESAASQLHLLVAGPAGDLWVSGADGILLRHRSAAQPWTPAGPSEPGTATALSFSGGGSGWLARMQADSVALFLTTNAGTTWAPMPSPEGAQAIRSMRCFDRDSGWLLDESGRLWMADSASFAACSLQVRLASFPTASTGFLLSAGDTLWRTTDAGRSWGRLESDLESDSTLRALLPDAVELVFPAPGRGCLLTADGILISQDGGAGWILAASGDSLFRSIAVDEYLNEYLVGGRQVLRGVDQGFSWEVRSAPDFSHTLRTDAATAWALDRGLTRSLDGGRVWLRVDLPIPLRGLDALVLHPGGRAWLHRAADLGPTLYRTTDGGGSWRAADRERHLAKLRTLRMDSGEIGHAGCAEGLFSTQDGGDTWSRMAAFPDSAVRSLFFLDDRRGWAATERRMLRTTDGGMSWDRAALPEPIIYDLAFLTPDTGFAAGAAVHRTSDGGLSWEQALPAGQDTGAWRAFGIADRFVIWACGDGGRMGATGDGWTFEAYHPDLFLGSLAPDLRKISMASAERGMTGDRGHLLLFDPDDRGPNFNLNVNFIPYLDDYTELHISAHEPVLGDTLAVFVGGERVPVRVQDPEGFLFRCRYRIRSSPPAQYVTVTGADLGGNRHAQVIPFRASRGAVEFASGTSRILVEPAGPGQGFGVFVGLPEEDLLPLPAGWIAAGQAARFTASNGERYGLGNWHLLIDHGAPSPGMSAGDWAAMLAVSDGTGWQPALDSENGLPESLRSEGPWIVRAVWVPRGTPTAQPFPDQWKIQAWPSPASGPVSIVLLPADGRIAGWPGGNWRIRIFDSSGRLLAERRAVAPGRILQWAGQAAGDWHVSADLRPGGRIPSGIYWIEARPDGQPNRRLSRSLVLLR